jgi:nucleotide-binding universal stress UspA family protein
MLIAHATANLEPSDIGFIHGAALAASQHGERALVTMHVEDGNPVDKPVGLKVWLSRWGYPADHVKQVYFSQKGYEDPADGLLAACRATRPDLLILPTHARSGMSRIFTGSVAEAVARNVSIPCLMLPNGGHKLVDEASGHINLERVLVLGGSQPDAQLGVDTATWFTREVGREQAQVTMLHAFDRTPFPDTTAAPGRHLRVQHRAGELTDVVVMVCAELQPQLVVMVSHGHDQLRDVLLANRTERVLRAAHRPLLWVPPTFRPPT